MVVDIRRHTVNESDKRDMRLAHHTGSSLLGISYANKNQQNLLMSPEINDKHFSFIKYNETYRLTC